MKKLVYAFFAILLFSQQFFSQDLREEITLKGNVYKIFDVSSEDQNYQITKYQIVDKNNNSIEHIARKYDKSKNKEEFLGIYRKNESEIHFIEFNQTKEPNTLDHFVYAPNNKGKLQLVRKEMNLKDYPSDLPPKFKDNKPIHPEFPGGDAKLNEWISKNIFPLLKSKVKNKEMVLTLDIDADGVANLVNPSLLNLSPETENKLTEAIKKMPKWNTVIQGYKVTGAVFIPVSVD